MQNKKLYLLIILYPFWIIISFYLIYLCMTEGSNALWAFSSYTFKRYLLIVFPISVAWAGYILTSGNLKNIKNKIKEILIISSILLVFAFTMIQWTGVTTLYGQYGTPVKLSPNEAFLIPREDAVTAYEHETLYREAIKVRYDTTFRKIWTFGFVVFFSTFLLLYATNKNNRDE